MLVPALAALTASATPLSESPVEESSLNLTTRASAATPIGCTVGSQYCGWAMLDSGLSTIHHLPHPPAPMHTTLPYRRTRQGATLTKSPVQTGIPKSCVSISVTHWAIATGRARMPTITSGTARGSGLRFRRSCAGKMVVARDLLHTVGNSRF
jgi:hypothetical protein